MNKQLIYKILTNNLVFVLLEMIFLGLVLLGLFDRLMPANYGAWISYEGYRIVIAGSIVIIICAYVLAYKRYNIKDSTISSLMNYYNLSFILMMLLLIKLLTLPAFSALIIGALIVSFFFLLSFFVSLLHWRRIRSLRK